MDLFKKIAGKLDEGVAKLTRDKDVQKWLDAVDDGLKREKHWRDEATRVTAIYEQEKNPDKSSDVCSFNILYANTETLSPAVYNNTPRPVVKRKTDRENPVAVACAQVLKKVLEHLADTHDTNYATFDDLQKAAVLEALVPGRGLCRFSYDADVEESEEGEPQNVKYETVCGDAVPWNRVVYGYAKQWADIPWMAYEHFMTREECIETFGDKLGNALKLTHAPKEDDDKAKSTPANADGVKFCHLYEIWDKKSRKVIWVSEGWPKVIKEEPDPLGLEGFFNSPRPIQYLGRISSLVPQTLYLMYEEQAKELEDVSRRIGHIVRAMKIRGFYDGTLEGLDDLLTKPENTLLPAKNVAALQQGMTLEKAIWLMPLEQLIQVLQQLYVNRTQIIGVIHQLTGVADIMRGESTASETLGAQKIKEAWGTMRLKRMQKETQRFARDCFRLQAELAAKHFGVETLKAMSGLQFPMRAEQEQAKIGLQQLQQQAQMAQQPGMQPPPQQIVQQAQEQAAKLQQTIQTPSWEDISEFLKNDEIVNFRIDIETNSTVDIEATEDKAELSEMMNSMAQLLNGVLPMVEQGVMPFDAAKALMLTVVSKFRLGDEVEEAFKAMQQPQPKADPAQQKVEAEMKRDQQKHDMEMQSHKQETDQKTQLAQMQLEVEREKLDIQREQNRLDRELMMAKHQLEMEKLAAQTVAKTVPAAAPAQPQGAQNAGA